MAKAGRIIITIDGPAGSGKTTLAKGLASELGYACINTGATYRAAALMAMRNGLELSDTEAFSELVSNLNLELEPSADHPSGCRIRLNGEDVSDDLWTNDISSAASVIGQHKCVRDALVEMQREIARKLLHGEKENRYNGVVVEGRDAGTVIFPEADIKFYLISSLEMRAERRLEDFHDESISLRESIEEIRGRDCRDTERLASPLREPENGFTIDNTSLDKEETLKKALLHISKTISC